jgi:hypothetical protein
MSVYIIDLRTSRIGSDCELVNGLTLRADEEEKDSFLANGERDNYL